MTPGRRAQEERPGACGDGEPQGSDQHPDHGTTLDSMTRRSRNSRRSSRRSRRNRASTSSATRAATCSTSERRSRSGRVCGATSRPAPTRHRDRAARRAGRRPRGDRDRHRGRGAPPGAGLVKRHRPPFNVRLRDDKSFPYIAVTVEDEYPRVMFTRERHRRGVTILVHTRTRRRCARRSTS